jgi:hypothetical protein
MKTNALSARKKAPTRARDWYSAPSYVTEFTRFPLTAEQVNSVLRDTRVHQRSVDEKRSFVRELEIAIGAYINAKRFFGSKTPRIIGRRLKWIRDRTVDLLAGSPDSRGRAATLYATPNASPITNPDEVTGLLLRNALSQHGESLQSIQKALLALYDATQDALSEQKRFPNVARDFALHELTYRVAIIARDVLKLRVTKAKDGAFARFVREAARIAGRPSVSNETIFQAADRLDQEGLDQGDSVVGGRVIVQAGKSIRDPRSAPSQRPPAIKPVYNFFYAPKKKSPR